MAKSKITLFVQKLPDKPFQYEDDQAYKDFESQAISGRYVFKITREHPLKSQKQLGYIFGAMISKIKEEGNEKRQDGVDGLLKYLLDPSVPKNQPLTDDFIKAVLYAIAPTFDRNDRKITLSSMNTVQANDFMKRVQDMMAGYVYLPDPDPNWHKQGRPAHERIQ